MVFLVEKPSKSGTFRYRARLQVRPTGPAPKRVEVLGEVGDWLNPIALQPCEQGWCCELELPAGVYSYKLRIDGRWTIDDGNGRTRSRGGHRNSVLSAGGAPEPVLFAPALPWVFDDESGATVLTAGLRSGHGEGLHVLWRECGEALVHRTKMEPCVHEDEHVLLRAQLALSAAHSEVRFELEGGQVVGPEDGSAWFVIERRAEDLPAWWREAVVYTIFVDRFRPEQDRADWGAQAGRDLPAGGHLEGIRRSLGELSDLGVNVLYLTPIHVAAHCHRYDLVDPLRVDPTLGGERAMEGLLADAHGRGMRVLLDFSFAHAGRGFPAFEHVLQHGSQSEFAAWFRWKRGRLQHYGRRRDAPVLNLDHPAVRELVLQAAELWARVGVDGFRLDAAAEVPHELARAVRAKLTEIRPDAVVLGEVVPEHAWRWRTEGAVDVATDFGFHAAVTEYIAKRTIDAAEACRWMTGSEVARGGPHHRSVQFLSTHDHTRFATHARMHGGRERAALGLLALLTSPGVPSLLYGEEVGLAADVVELLPEHVWKDRAPMPWEASQRDERLRALVRRLLAARAKSPALQRGSRVFEYAEGPLLVYRRQSGQDAVDVAINASDLPAEFDLEDDRLQVLEPIATVGETRVSGQSVVLGANAGIVARRSRPASAKAQNRIRCEANERARDAAFASGSVRTASRPVRIDLTVTERCNMRCRHCINDSPQRTSSGAARTMSRAVLDRLRSDFALAGYFGFVHGGESLASPMFFEAMRAIRDEASGPTVVHLLSNGLLLTEQNVARFVELGGNSLMVSLDGATAAVNDAVREQFERVVGNVRGAVEWRKSTGADLRIGLSLVVMPQNTGELAAFAELGAGLGVDWIKLEELVAKRQLTDTSIARNAVEGAMARGRALGLVMVDHTRERTIQRCGMDEETRAFVQADEFANRARIHPCRAPWDHACVDPNGDVHAADFFAPVIGNVMSESLEVIWAGEAAQAERARSMGRWVCAGGCPES
jgi:cyclomaltodextrinase / maltogenic alpha-amylase / neopullulanase